MSDPRSVGMNAIEGLRERKRRQTRARIAEVAMELFLKRGFDATTVDDIAASTEKAKSLGATIVRDVTEVMGMGWFTIIMDPTGAGLALWKAAPRTA